MWSLAFLSLSHEKVERSIPTVPCRMFLPDSFLLMVTNSFWLNEEKNLLGCLVCIYIYVCLFMPHHLVMIIECPSWFIDRFVWWWNERLGREMIGIRMVKWGVPITVVTRLGAGNPSRMKLRAHTTHHLPSYCLKDHGFARSHQTFFCKPTLVHLLLPTPDVGSQPLTSEPITSKLQSFYHTISLQTAPSNPPPKKRYINVRRHRKLVYEIQCFG